MNRIYDEELWINEGSEIGESRYDEDNVVMLSGMREEAEERLIDLLREIR